MKKYMNGWIISLVICQIMNITNIAYHVVKGKYIMCVGAFIAFTICSFALYLQVLNVREKQ